MAVQLIHLGVIMKRIVWMIAVASLPLWALADDVTKIDAIEKKVDVIDKKVDTVIERQGRIYDKVENNPLQGRNYGVELNLFRLLTIQDVSHSISGTVSYFNHARNAEIALPFFYWSDRYGGNEGRFTLYTLDAHYRYFLGDTINGFFVGGFGRLARLHGRTGDGWDVFIDNIAHPYATETKFGIGVGVGYRIFSKNGIYWGTSLSAGRYISGENDKFISANFFGDEDSQTIIDFELLKFGYAF